MVWWNGPSPNMCLYSERRGSSVIGLFSGLHSQAEFSHCCQKRKCPSVTVAELWGFENSHRRCKISLVLANGAVERYHLLRKCVNVCFLIFLKCIFSDYAIFCSNFCWLFLLELLTNLLKASFNKLVHTIDHICHKCQIRQIFCSCLLIK